MARGRFLSESVAKDRRLNDLSVEAALVYIMAIPHLDRDGIIDGDAPVLWGTVCPRRRALLDHMDAIIAEWVACGLVIAYETDNGGAIWFCGFKNNQQGMHYDREARSRFCPPPGYIRIESGIVSTPEQPDAIQGPDKVRTRSGQGPAEVKVEVEVEVKDQGEGEGESNETAAPLSSAPPEQPKSPRSSKPKTPQPEPPPAVGIWRDVFLRYPQKAQFAKFVHITDLALWLTICETWRDRGYKPTNIAGPLEWYADPSKMERYINGHHAPISKVQQSMNAVDAVFDMAEQKGIIIP